MYHWIWTVVGLALVVIVSLEVFGTTTQSGLAPLTRLFARGVRRLLSRLHRVAPTNLKGKLGVVETMAMVAAWIAWTWIGWSLVFMGHEQAVVKGATGEPADVWARIYFAGFVFSTLGLGDYEPGGPVWQMLTAFGSTLGFFLVTFSISFLVPLVQAAMGKWKLALSLHRTLPSPETAIIEAWNGERLPSLSNYFETVRTSIVDLEHSMRLYPMLWDFRNQSHLAHVVMGLTRLYETLLLAEFGLREGALDRGIAQQMRRALTGVQMVLLDLAETDIELCDVPPPPLLTPLRHAGLPVSTDEAFDAHVARHADARRNWHVLMHAEGIDWELLRRSDEASLLPR
jgi:hypothetical protein